MSKPVLSKPILSKPEWIARQSSHPRGWLGAVVSRVMAFDTARVNETALEQLAPVEGEDILEVGCGHGRTLRRLSALTSSGALAGIDPSDVMLADARRRNAAALAAGRIQIEQGDAAHVPFGAASFNAAFTVHTLYFWPDVAAGLTEIRRVLRPEGRLLLVHRPLDAADAASDLPASVYVLRSVEGVEKQLSETGFADVRTELRGDAKSRLAFTIAFANAEAQ